MVKRRKERMTGWEEGKHEGNKAKEKIKHFRGIREIEGWKKMEEKKNDEVMAEGICKKNKNKEENNYQRKEKRKKLKK